MFKRLLLLPALLLTLGMQAQTVDTLLFENFEWDYDHTGDWGFFPFGDDTTFINLDADGLAPSTGDPLEYAWFWSDVFNSPDTLPNAVLGSRSWMEGFAVGNRNWLILPPVTLPNNSYTFHWKSAPYQLLRYMDGYSVLAAEGSNDVALDVFTDTLFRAAQMIDIIGDGEVQTVDNYTFSEGYIHANSLLDSAYYDYSDPTLYVGYLEPHSVSLAPYAGKTMYFAIVHDSDDDNLLMIDDLLIVGNTTSGTQQTDVEVYRFVTYPNPVESNLNVLFRLPESALVSLQVSDMSGRVVRQPLHSVQLPSGEHQEDLRLLDLPAGPYSVTLTIGQQTITKVVVKK